MSLKDRCRGLFVISLSPDVVLVFTLEFIGKAMHTVDPFLEECSTYCKHVSPSFFCFQSGGWGCTDTGVRSRLWVLGPRLALSLMNVNYCVYNKIFEILFSHIVKPSRKLNYRT